ncbi:MAG: hypothetical protein AB7F76_10810 [Parvibaculaceae bacterium]
MSKTPRLKGLRQFLDPEQQRAWLAGKAKLRDAEERNDEPELRFKFAPRLHRLMRLPQAPEALKLFALYGRAAIPIPRKTERYYWSVSCLPSSAGRPLIRVNASWMELFTLYADGDGVPARFILHLSDFTTDGSPTENHVDEAFLRRSVAAPEDAGWFFVTGADIFGVTVRGSASIRKFLKNRRALRGIRNFNLTHMNRGRNAYQASHCYSVADYLVGALAR